MAFALRIQELLKAEDDGEWSEEELLAAAAELRKKPRELREAMRKLRVYRAAYPDQHPANAFTPVDKRSAQPPVSKQGTIPATAEAKVASEKRQPRKGIPIALVPEPEQSRIRTFAERIHDLIALRNDLGRVPRGERERVAAEFGCTPDWVAKNMQLQQAYVAAYPDEPFYNAHTPRPLGRPKGRIVPEEVKETIELARINKRWLARNGAGGYDEIDHVIEKKLIHSLIVQHFGEIHSASTTYRIISDYEERRAARVEVADNDPGVLQEHLPTISNKARGPGERAQFDARALPVVVDNDGVLCTVHMMLVFDDATGYLASWALIPAKRVDDEKEIYRQAFTDQLSRATVARAVMQVGRFRTFYADHGYEAFQRSMIFMVAPGEDPTLLLHSRVARPRGRGKVERGVQLVDGFLKTRPYYVRERDFRRSRAKKRSEIRTFAQCCEDFAAYVAHWNNDGAPGGNPSRAALLKQGPSFFLTPPPVENLAMFALSQRREQREPRRDGDVWFWLDSCGYEPYRRDAALYKQFADLSGRGGKIDIILFSFDLQAQEGIVLFSLDGQQTWEVAVPAGNSDCSGQRHQEQLKAVEQQLARDDAVSLEAFFQKIILGSIQKPLVLNGLARERGFYYHAPPAISPAEEPQAGMVEGDTAEGPQTPMAQNDLRSDTPERTPDPVPGAKVSNRSRTGRTRRGKTPFPARPTTDADVQPSAAAQNSNAEPSCAPNIIGELLRRRQ